MWPINSLTMLAINNFTQKKGLRQVDPLPSILFNIVIDMIDVRIERAKADGQFKM